MIKQFLTFGVFIFLILSLLIYLLQRYLIYFPTATYPTRQFFHAEDMQQRTLHTSDGLLLNAWYKPAVANQPTLLYLHGNAGHIGFRMPLIRQFLTKGVGVFLLEYRGYGGNKGSPTEQGLYTDGRTAMRYLQQQKIRTNQVVLYGESLGSGVATQLASEFSVCAVILQSPYTSLPDVARYHYPWIFIPPWDKFNSLERIATIKAPLLILHGKQDQIVPFTQGVALFHYANQPKYFLAFEEKGHNNLWDSNFFNQVNQFIQAHCSSL